LIWGGYEQYYCHEPWAMVPAFEINLCIWRQCFKC
jgi:hypothetical protein